MSRIGTNASPFLTENGTDETLYQGLETYEVWEGSAAEIDLMRGQMLATGATRISRASKGDGNFTIRGSWPFDTSGGSIPSFVDTLELETNLVQRSVYQSPIYRTKFHDCDAYYYSPIANATVTIVARAQQLLQSLQPTVSKVTSGGTNTQSIPNVTWEYTPIGASTPVAYTSAESAAEAYVLDHLKRVTGITLTEAQAAVNLFMEVAYMGVTSFWEFGTVFRRTVTASVPAAVSANFTGAGMIWTSAEVAAFEGIPTSGGWFNLPAGVQWIKDKPRVLKAYGQKTQLTYCYTEIVTASALLYQAVGTAILIHA